MKTASARKWVRFKFRDKPGSKVFVAGTFNNWSPTDVKLKDREKNGLYEALLLLNLGKNEYRFMVNGIWQPDPDSVDSVLDPSGSRNSVIDVA